MSAPVPCPRCGAELRGDQAWCLECGLAARTRLAAMPNWRAPLIAAGAIGVAALVALAVAFVILTGDNAPVPTTTPAPVVPTTAPPATAPPVTTAPPATTVTITTPTATTPTATTPTVTAAPTP